MQIITLKDNQSEHFRTITYPDGQKTILLNWHMLNQKKEVNIKCAIKNFAELEVLSCLVAALKTNDFYIQSLRFKYLFGMRSDRIFITGEPSYFKDIVAPIINSFDIPSVYVLGPHSLKILRWINAYEDNDLFDNISTTHKVYDQRRIYLGADESSDGKYWGINFLGNFIKNRSTDYNGLTVRLADISLIEQLRSPFENIYIVDDLCDGGATFIEIAKYLRAENVTAPLNLIVTHALFTKGIGIVAEHYDQIICTNSYQDIAHPKVKQIKVI